LKTNEAVLATLPTLEFFTIIRNSHNVGNIIYIFIANICSYTLDLTYINRLENIAFGNNDVDSAKKVLKLLLEDDLNLEKKRKSEIDRKTPEEIAAIDEKRRKTAEKRADTKLKNLKKKKKTDNMTNDTITK
jgi:hypothetical protein